MMSSDGAVIDRIGYGSSGGGYQYPPLQNYGFSGHSNYGYEYGSSGGKKSVALSALTLLAFLFFLHILQTCVQDHINSMNPQVVVMATRASNTVGFKNYPNRQHKGEIETVDEEDKNEEGDEEDVWEGGEGRSENNGHVKKLKAQIHIMEDENEEI